MTRIYTIGHSNRSSAELVRLLINHQVHRVIDVRKIPHSRFNPHFNREALHDLLHEEGIEYFHLPAMGGFRRPVPGSLLNTGWQEPAFQGFADYMLTPEFERAFDELLKLAEEGTSAILCAEADYLRCHRRLISDAILVRGMDVLHIVKELELEPHKLTDFAEVQGTRVTYPGDGPSQPRLF